MTQRRGWHAAHRAMHCLTWAVGCAVAACANTQGAPLPAVGAVGNGVNADVAEIGQQTDTGHRQPQDAGPTRTVLSVPTSAKLLDRFEFAIVGDTRPAFKNATAAYPTAVVNQIWQRVGALVPPVPFAVTTGDYVFSSVDGVQAAAQLDLYLGAQSAFAGDVWHAMGNHECTGYTASNCGVGASDGEPKLYTTYLAKMVGAGAAVLPWFSQWYQGTDQSWSAKVIVTAANAWSAEQAAWFEAELAKPSTYTLIVRHEGSNATNAPGVKPTAKIMAKYPYTLLIVGHSHTYQYFPGKREVVVGNGGAPATSAVPFGFVVGRQRDDGALEFSAFNAATGAVMDSFALTAAGATANPK